MEREPVELSFHFRNRRIGAAPGPLAYDHGEGLGNHHWMLHGNQICDEQVWVRLIFDASDGSLPPRRWKYVHRTRGRDELFDLRGDPYETRDLVTERPERAREMKVRLLARLLALREGPTPEPDPVDAQTAERLEELGHAR
jgi:hypothetical protein